MEPYNFVEFQPTGGRYNMVISLGKPDRFYLASAFCKKYSIEHGNGVKLFFDKDKMAIGFKFLKEMETGTVGLKKLGSDSFYITAKAFLGMNDIPIDKYLGRYKPIDITSSDGKKIFVIELKEKEDKN
jgi:hypothetical protein